MGSLTRRIKRNIMENTVGIRACTKKGVQKKLKKLENEVAQKTKTTLSGNSPAANVPADFERDAEVQ